MPLPLEVDHNYSKGPENTCRACLQWTDEGISLYDYMDHLKMDVSSILGKFSIEAKPKDGFPDIVCLTCFKIIENFFEFWKTFVISQSILKVKIERDKVFEMAKTNFNHTCPVCFISMIDYKDFASHVINLHNENTITCTLCKKQVVKQRYLLHYNTVHKINSLAIYKMLVKSKSNKPTKVQHTPKKETVIDDKTEMNEERQVWRFDESNDEIKVTIWDTSQSEIELAPETLEEIQTGEAMIIETINEENLTDSLEEEEDFSEADQSDFIRMNLELEEDQSQTDSDLGVTIELEDTEGLELEEEEEERSKSKVKRVLKKEEPWPDSFLKFNARANHACPCCPKIFYLFPQFLEHVVLHGNCLRTCPICQRNFNQMDLYLDHYRAEHRFQCKVCNAPFMRKDALISHFRRHDATIFPMYNCSYEGCDKKYPNKYTLLKHEYNHRDDVIFECDVCKKTFKTPCALKQHRRQFHQTHNFICTYCGKTFTAPSLLNMHLRIHTGERPYTCELCGYKFAQHSGLKRHLNKHANGYTGHRFNRFRKINETQLGQNKPKKKRNKVQVEALPY